MRVTVAEAINRLGTVVEWLVILLTGALVLIVSANVFMRYVLEVGLLWAEEVSRLTFVWLVFLGAFTALRRRAHLALTFVYDRFSSRLQVIVKYAGALLVLLFLGVLVWHGMALVLQTLRFGRVTPILGISAAWGYLSVPVGAFLMFLEMVRQLLIGEGIPEQQGERTDGPAGLGGGTGSQAVGTPGGLETEAVGAKAPESR